jgi:hypothetical protein
MKEKADPYYMAAKVVDQWDEHDIFRFTLGDDALWDGIEPNEVAIARELLKHPPLPKSKDKEETDG